MKGQNDLRYLMGWLSGQFLNNCHSCLAKIASLEIGTHLFHIADDVVVGTSNYAVLARFFRKLIRQTIRCDWPISDG